jgi:hypothetical protein
MQQRELRRERKFRTLKLLPQDRELLRNIGHGRPDVADRYGALLQLTDIVRNEQIPNEPPEPERRSLRLGIPRELDQAVSRLAKRTGRTYISVLLAAARVYRQRFPLQSDSGQ